MRNMILSSGSFVFGALSGVLSVVVLVVVM